LARATAWEKYALLLEQLRAFEPMTPTAELLEAAGLAYDPRGGIGALHAASAIGRCHANTGGRRRLRWSPGRRPEGEPIPKFAREREYKLALLVLAKEPKAALPTSRLQDVVGRRSRQEVVGAMKLFVAAGLVVHLILKPRSSNGGISCWGWLRSDLRREDREYRPGQPPKPPLSLDWKYSENWTLADAYVARRTRTVAPDDL
jgi:hypothetical protein